MEEIKANYKKFLDVCRVILDEKTRQVTVLAQKRFDECSPTYLLSPEFLEKVIETQVNMIKHDDRKFVFLKDLLQEMKENVSSKKRKASTALSEDEKLPAKRECKPKITVVSDSESDDTSKSTPHVKDHLVKDDDSKSCSPKTYESDNVPKNVGLKENLTLRNGIDVNTHTQENRTCLDVKSEMQDHDQTRTKSDTEENSVNIPDPYSQLTQIDQSLNVSVSMSPQSTSSVSLFSPIVPTSSDTATCFKEDESEDSPLTPFFNTTSDNLSTQSECVEEEGVVAIESEEEEARSETELNEYTKEYIDDGDVLLGSPATSRSAVEEDDEDKEDDGGLSDTELNTISRLITEETIVIESEDEEEKDSEECVSEGDDEEDRLHADSADRQVRDMNEENGNTTPPTHETSDQCKKTPEHVSDNEGAQNGNSDPEPLQSTSNSSNLQTSNAKKKGSRKQIQRLEKLLEKIRDKIHQVEERELSLDDLDDETSSYILVEKLKSKFVKVYEKLCALHNSASTTGRPNEKLFKYEGSRYPAVNKMVSKFINRKKVFPDYHDIRKVIMKVNRDKALRLRKQEVDDLAREVFTDVGDQLQQRRQKDFAGIFSDNKVDPYSTYDDPALLDRDLRKRLEENKKAGRTKLEQVIEKFTTLQHKRKNCIDDEDEDDGEEEDKIEKGKEEEEEIKQHIDNVPSYHEDEHRNGLSGRSSRNSVDSNPPVVEIVDDFSPPQDYNDQIDASLELCETEEPSSILSVSPANSPKEDIVLDSTAQPTHWVKTEIDNWADDDENMDLIENYEEPALSVSLSKENGGGFLATSSSRPIVLSDSD